MASGCSFCLGVWHPSTGAWYGAGLRACGPCVRSWLAWFKQHTAPRKKGPDFYAAAAKWSQKQNAPAEAEA
jgi:hypothetical protein